MLCEFDNKLEFEDSIRSYTCISLAEEAIPWAFSKQTGSYKTKVLSHISCLFINTYKKDLSTESIN